jgi:hypothetical protein
VGTGSRKRTTEVTDREDDVAKGRRSSAVGSRFSVGLIRQAQDALDSLVRRHGYGRVDAVNRALVIYALIDNQIESGRKIVFRDPETQEEEVLLITP